MNTELTPDTVDAVDPDASFDLEATAADDTE